MNAPPELVPRAAGSAFSAGFWMPMIAAIGQVPWRGSKFTKTNDMSMSAMLQHGSVHTFPPIISWTSHGDQALNKETETEESV